MMPAQLHTLKQSLNKAFCLGKPKHANLEAFKANLVKLFHQIDENANEGNVLNYVNDLLTGTYSAPGYPEPENNSSPVCYAHMSGLRVGFDDPFSPNIEPADSNNKFSGDTSIFNTQIGNPDLNEAIQITRMCVWEITTNWQESTPTNTVALKKQIDELVYKLYEIKS